MCGIFGFTGERNKKLLKCMSNVTIYRGPDQQGFYNDGKINLGCNRLSIVGVQNGKQPISNEDKNIWVIMNGEIYNYLELKKELIDKGHIFSTDSDAEVIVHLYEEIGVDFVHKLRGMFGIALWDKSMEKLVLVRDRLGQKPLYYTSHNNCIYFASEIKAILEEKKIIREVDMGVFECYLSLTIPLKNKTMFKNIFRVQQGHMVIFSKKTIKIKKYWEYSPDVKKYSDVKIVRNIDRLVKESTQIRLMGEVPVGIFLSGGLDSGAITFFAAEKSDKIKALTVAFGEKNDETNYAKKTAKRCNIKHKIVNVKGDVEKYIEKIIWHLDEPMPISTPVSLFSISNIAKKDFTVVLTGDGGDEVFSGYPHHKTFQIIEKHKKIFPLFIRKLIRKFVVNIPPTTRIKRYLKFISSESLEEMYDDYLCTFSETEKKRILKKLPFVDIRKNIRSYFGREKDLLSYLQKIELNTMGERFNIRLDKVTMAHSLEARSPLLDHKLIEFLSTVDSAQKNNTAEQKVLLRKIMKNRLPPEVLSAKKRGFTAPEQKWFKEGLKKFAYKIFLRNRQTLDNFFNIKEVYRILEQSDNNSRYASQALTILVFIIWHETFIDCKKTVKYSKRSY